MIKNADKTNLARRLQSLSPVVSETRSSSPQPSPLGLTFAHMFEGWTPRLEHSGPSIKLQPPSSREAPNPKLQSTALPRSVARLGEPQAGPIRQYFKAAVEVWSLVFPWRLVFGVWRLGGDAF